MAIKLITASGAPYQLGYEIGQAVKATVQSIAVHNEEFVEAEQKWLGTDYISQMIKCTEEAFPALVEELKGMADGMGIEYERAFVWNCRGDLRWPDDISPKLAFSLSEGCTTVMSPQSKNTSAFVAHNEDGSADFEGHCFWLSAKPEGAPAFESFLYPGMIAGHSMGANSAGIIQTINNIRVHDLKPGIPRHFICRAILAATSMSEALELLDRADRASGFHHNLGSAKEELLVSSEAPASGHIKRMLKQQATAHANHLIYPEFEAVEQSITHSSKVRQQRANEILEEQSHQIDDARTVLFDKKAGYEILRQPSDGGDDYGQTLATGIFKMTNDGIDIDVFYEFEDTKSFQRKLQLD